MAISPFKIFVSGEVLTASDLNSLIAHIIDNGESLGWPATVAKDLDGRELILDTDGDTSITADTDDRIDFRIAAADRFRMQESLGIPDFRIIWGDSDTAAGPYLSLYRNSSTPDDSDIMGAIRFLGNDDGAAETEYARIEGHISDVTDTTEDGRLVFNIMKAGSLFEVMRLGDGGLLRLNSDDATAAAGPILQLTRSSASPDDDDVLGQILFRGLDDGATLENFAYVEGVAEDVTSGTEDGRFQIYALVNGSATRVARFGASGARFENTGLSVGSPTGGTPTTTGHINAVAIFDDNAQLFPLSSGVRAQQATTSGTAFNFTSIRSSTKRITMVFHGVSLSGTDDFLIQIGDSGGLEATGYLSTSVAAGGSASSSTTGFLIRSAGAAGVISGMMTIVNISGNAWIASHNVKGSTSSAFVGGGDKTLSDVLDRITLTRTGSNTFDAGAVTVIEE